MAIAYLGYKVDSKDLVTAEQRLDKMDAAAGKAEVASKSLAATAVKLSVAFGGVAAAAASLRGAFNATQTYQKMSNALRGMGLSADQSADALRSVAEISRATRAPLEATAKLYQRVSIAGRDLGASNADVLAFTESVGLALGSAGIGANEASGALLQLSQAMAGGTVRAEEFNSILEGAFPIAQAAANGIDAAAGSVGKLRNLVIEGKVSSKEFFDAIIGQSNDLRAAFENTAPTISQAFGVLRTNLVMAVGEFDAATGASSKFAEIILVIAGGLDQVAGYAIAASGAAVAAYSVSIYKAASATIAWATSLAVLKGALIASGVGIAVVAAGALINKFLALVKATGSFGGAMSAVKDVATEIAGRVPLIWDAMVFKVIAGSMTLKSSVVGAFASILESASDAQNLIVKGFKWAVDGIAALFGSIGAVVSKSVGQAVNFVLDKIEGLVNKAIAAVNKLIDGLNNIPSVNIGKIGSAAIGRVSEGVGGAIAAISDFSLGGAAEKLRGVSNEMRDAAQTASDLGDAFWSVGTAPLDSVAAMKDMIDNATESTNNLSDAMGGAGDAAGLSGAAKKAGKSVKKTKDDVTDLAKAMNSSLTSAIDGVADAWGNWVVNGFRDFKGFVSNVLNSFKSMLAQMIAAAARNKIMLSLGIGGSATGTAATAASGLLGGGGGLLGGIGGAVSGIASGIGGILSGGGLGASFANLGGLMTGSVGGFGAIGAAIPAVGLLAVAIGLFTKKVKVLDTGLRGTIDGMTASIESYKKIKTSRLFGLISKTSTNYTADPDNPLHASIASIQGSVAQAARVFGYGADVFDAFSYSFKLSLQGLSEEDAITKIQEELLKMGDQFAALVPNFEDMNSLLAAANQAVAETAALGSTRFEGQMLAAARRRGEIEMNRQTGGNANANSLIRLSKVEENTDTNNKLMQRLVEYVEMWTINGVPVESTTA